MTAPPTARVPPRAAEHDARAALAAARIDAPGGKEQLVAVLRASAERYVVSVLALRDPTLVADVVGVSVARTLRTLPRDHGPDELTEHLHLAVRHEVWRRQRTVPPTTRRVLAAAALVLIVAGLGALTVGIGRTLDGSDPPVHVAAMRSEPIRVVGGRVVDTSEGGTVLGGRSDVAVAVVAGGRTVRATETDASGRFSVEGLDPGIYEVLLTVPADRRLSGAPDGRSTTVDLTDRSEDDLVLELQRS